MAANRLLKLVSVCSKIGSGATPRGGNDAYKGGATALIRSQNIYNDGFHRDGLAYIDDLQAAELSNVEVRPDDVLLNITGDSVARCCQVPHDVLPARVNQHVAIIRPMPAELDARFLRYALVSDTMQNRLFALASAGATRDALTKGMIESLEISAPKLADQKVIASILGALDDKIELNRRMNATLETMARALFQSWFVDFDPVRAKLDGRKPGGMDDATAAHFPEHFQDSPLGPTPQGWEMKALGEISDLNWGDTNTTKASYVAEGFTAYSASGADGYLPHFDYERDGIVVSAIGANAGITWLAHGKWSCIKNTLRFWAIAPNVSTEFLFFATYDQEKWPQRGSAQPFISQGDARAMKVLVPANGLAEHFGAIVRPWLTKIESNNQQSRSLAKLRDTLLPRLLSGDLRVQNNANAEKGIANG